MRAYLFLLVVSGLPAVAQNETNMSCVERLEIPSYPILAKQARITGVLTVTVPLGPDASAGRISSQWASQWNSVSKPEGLFLPVIEKSLLESRFAKSCAGK